MLARAQLTYDSDISLVTNSYYQIDIHSGDQVISKGNHRLCHVD